MVFNEQWFLKHQTILLWFINTNLGKLFFCINGKRSSVGKNKIIKLLPNSITWKVGKLYSTEFRIHDKFSKRLFYGLKPVWYLLHFWDTLFANNLNSHLNLGFDTLTAYPDASTGATTVDGRVYRQGVSESFATLRAGAGTNVDATGSGDDVYLESTSSSNVYTSLQRSIQTFNTAALTAQSVLNSAVLSLFGQGKANGLGSLDLHVAGSTPAANNTLVAADYSQVQTTSFGSVAYASFSIVAYNDITLNSTGVAAISKTSITKFSEQISADILNSASWSSAAISSLQWASADTAGTTNDPKLVVTYYKPQAAMI